MRLIADPGQHLDQLIGRQGGIGLNRDPFQGQVDARRLHARRGGKRLFNGGNAGRAVGGGPGEHDPRAVGLGQLGDTFRRRGGDTGRAGRQ